MTDQDPNIIADQFQGQFLVSPAALQAKLFKIKAYVSDWDGVFNNGAKHEDGSSPFSEIDAMGTNMLRFNHYLRTNTTPFTAIITGEKNKAAFSLPKREHFNAVYYSIRHKADALKHFCDMHHLQPYEVAYFFDDIPDLSVAEHCGVRIMIGRPANPLLINFAKEHQLADYITYYNGNNMAVREISELLTGIAGLYTEMVKERMHYTATYQEYLGLRNQPVTQYYTSIASQITLQEPK